uniref:hypothetical protein n=1 Tax=Ningiella ruwaisensis TaxID=2364274 RepID=UPI0010A04691|nr:hypothetical protein [Ningiella ruwaisensis]
MKRFLTVLFASALVSFAPAFLAQADDRPVAEEDVVLELKTYCQDIANDEGTDGMSLDQFLLDCVNEELEAEGYQPVTQLPN